MASHYEQFQLVQGTGLEPKPIDFYRQSDLQQPINQNASNKRPSLIQQQQQQTYSASQKNFQEGGAAFDNNFQVDDASPITGLLQKSKQVNNYSEGLQKQSDGPREQTKKSLIDRQVASKRRSVESKEAITGNKQRDLLLPQDQLMQINNNNMLSGVKSALGNYSTEQQQLQQQPINNLGLKQIGKNTRVEANLDMNNQQQKRTLAKSQSQNRLLLVSPETLLNKNNPYQDIYQDGSGNNQNPSDNKNSFYKDPLGGRQTNQPSDLLYKQHMQYSSGGAGGHKSWQLKASKNKLLSGMTTKSECTFCNKTGGGAGWGGASSTIIPPHQCSAIYCAKDQQGMMIQNNLSKKYSTNRDYYNLKIVNDLIYNENTHIVSIFKDYLILDDINEFLKRSYNQQETKVRLPKLCSFYDKYSQVFPNYVCLPESKYMFKNIQRKQKLIDEQYQLQEELAKKQHQTLLDEDKLFNTKFYNSYYSNMGDISMTKKQYEEQAKQIATQAGKKVPIRTPFEQMRIDELVDRFLMKDSESNIQLITTAGLDFSGFTQGNSTFINPNFNHEKTPIKPEMQKATSSASNNKQNIKVIQQPKSLNVANKALDKKPSSQTIGENQKKQSTQQLQNANANVGQIVSQVNNRRQKTSFNNNQLQQQQQQSQKNTKVGTYPGAPKLDAQKIGSNGFNNLESSKTTPRIQKTNAQNVQVLQTQEINSQNLKQLIQTSPGTKDAIQNYLNNHQLEENELLRQSSGFQPPLKLNVNDLQKTHNLATMSSLLSPTNQNPTIYSESSSVKSQFNQKHLPLSGSQTALMTQQQLLQSNMNNNRANMKSQCSIPQFGNTQPLQMSQQQQQAISNLKKAGRLSGGGSKQSHQHRKNISPVPNQQQLQSDQQQHTLNTQQSSRNLQIANNSTQKSGKSVNSHAKYLSGGAEQYQKLLLNINNPNLQQNSYVTNYDTMNSNLVNSSNKKLLQQRSKQDMILDTFVGSQNSQQKMQHMPRQVEFTDALDNDIITGEDCDDCGIADERFASPDGLGLGGVGGGGLGGTGAGLHTVYQTIDDQARRSLEGTLGNGAFTVQNPQQMLMLTSIDENNKGGMLLSQYDNFDQIKKHLEQQCINNKKNQQQHQQVSYEQINSIPSGSKQYTLKSVEKTPFDDVKSSAQSLATGYNRDFMGQSVISQTQGHTTHSHTHTNSNQMNQNSNDKANSRNDATAQKQQYESIKQQIRGVYQQNNNNNIVNAEQSSQIQTTSKTPNKGSTHSKKSLNGNNQQQQQQAQTQQINLQQQQQINRMSIESANMLLMLPNQNSNTITNPNSLYQGPPPMTSTAASGQRQLSFSQASFSANNANYRSITNLQQRKTSNNNNNKDNSVEKKRLSQNRQSFKDLGAQQQMMSQQQQQQLSQTAMNEQQKIIKRSTTGKTLNIYDSNSNSNTINPSYLQSVQNNASLCNPTFISSSSGNASNKFYNTTHQQQNSIASTGSGQYTQQQQQAANTVRVMTPSYSLASLSKAISPTQMTSPMTMTVTLANNQNQVIGRKQVISSNKTKTALGVHQHTQNQGSLQSMLVQSHSQNYLLGDKTQSKLLTSTSTTSNPMQKTIISSKAQLKNINQRPNSTATSGMTGIGMGLSNGLATTVNNLQIASNINQKLGRQQQQQQLSQGGGHTLLQSNSHQNLLGNTPKSQLNLIDSQNNYQHQQQKSQAQNILNHLQQIQSTNINDNSHSQNLSCTVSTENNSSKQYVQGNSGSGSGSVSGGLMEMAAKALESKNPKFMRTIEEFGSGSGSGNNNNNLVSRKSGGGSVGLTSSVSQAQIEGKHSKQKVQTVVNSNQPSIKRNPTSTGQILSQSASVSHFKSSSQHLNTKKQQQQQQQMQSQGRH